MGTADPGALLPHQVFGNWLATTLVRLFYGYRYTDLGPFRAIRRDALNGSDEGAQLRLDDRDAGPGTRGEACGSLKYPIHYRIRAAGENKVSGNTKASLMAGYRIIATVLGIASRRGIQSSFWRP